MSQGEHDVYQFVCRPQKGLLLVGDVIHEFVGLEIYFIIIIYVK